jgi:hypothetical protein
MERGAVGTGGVGGGFSEGLKSLGLFERAPLQLIVQGSLMTPTKSC